MLAPGDLKYCRCHDEQGLLVITLDLPDLGNALDDDASRELGRVFDDLFGDRAHRAAVLTGSGNTFCLGAREGNGRNPPPSGFGGLAGRKEFPKPIVAAVNGDATAEGFDLALCCDLIVASETATFAYGIGQGGAHDSDAVLARLFAHMPRKRAMAALLTGAPITAPEGVLLGFVNDLSGRHDTVQIALSWAGRIADSRMAARARSPGYVRSDSSTS